MPFAPGPRWTLADRFVGRGGQPLHLQELLQHLSATGELERLVEDGAAADLPIPDSVRAVVAQRLAPPRNVELLEIAAVIGMSFDLALLAEVTGRPRPTCSG